MNKLELFLILSLIIIGNDAHSMTRNDILKYVGWDESKISLVPVYQREARRGSYWQLKGGVPVLNYSGIGLVCT